MNCGSCDALAPAELAAVQGRLAVRVGDRELAEVLALGGACRDVMRFLGDVLELLRRCGLRQRQQNMRDIELIVRRGRLLAREILLELVRRDVDVRDHVALPQGAQGQFLAHALAVLLVVDSLRRERRRQLIEGNLVALAISCRAPFNCSSEMVRPTCLARCAWISCRISRSSTCCLQHALRGQLDLLFLQPLGHRVHLRVQLALQHQAVVDDGRNAVEQLAVDADIAGLRTGGRRPRAAAMRSPQRTATLRISQIFLVLGGLLTGSFGSRVEYPRISVPRRNPHRFPTELRPVSSNCNAIEVSSPPVRLVDSSGAAPAGAPAAAFVLESRQLLDGLAVLEGINPAPDRVPVAGDRPGEGAVVLLQNVLLEAVADVDHPGRIGAVLHRNLRFVGLRGIRIPLVVEIELKCL